MAFFLGIDGGGSKTECMVGNETAVLGWAGSGSSKIARVGEEAAGAALRDGIQRACAAAGLGASQISRTCIGVAGVSQAGSVAAIRGLLGKIVAGEIAVVGDTEVAHHAAFDGGEGVVVISGTGSIAWGRNRQGEAARAGGLAPATGDPGSGEWIGRTAVELVLLASENGHSPAMLHAVLKAWKLEDLQELAQVLRGSPAPDFAALFPIVAVRRSHRPTRSRPRRPRAVAARLRRARQPLDRSHAGRGGHVRWCSGKLARSARCFGCGPVRPPPGSWRSARQKKARGRGVADGAPSRTRQGSAGNGVRVVSPKLDPHG